MVGDCLVSVVPPCDWLADSVVVDDCLDGVVLVCGWLNGTLLVVD